MTTPDLVVAGVVTSAVLCGYYIKGASGLGEAIPLAASGGLVLELDELVALITLLDLFAGGTTLLVSRSGVLRREDAASVLPLAAGLAVGVLALYHLGGSQLTCVFVAFLAGVALWLMWNHRPRQERATESRPHLVRALTVYAGLSGGVTGVEGPPLAAALLARSPDVDIRAPLMRLLFISAAFRTVLLAVAGLITLEAAAATVVLIPVAVLGFVAGRWRHPAVTSAQVARVCAAMCIISCGFLLWGLA